MADIKALFQTVCFTANGASAFFIKKDENLVTWRAFDSTWDVTCFEPHFEPGCKDHIIEFGHGRHDTNAAVIRRV